MRKTITILLLCIVTTTTIAQTLNNYHYHSGKVRLEGKIKNIASEKINGQVLILIDNIFTREEENVLLPIQSDGTFASDIHIPHSTYCYFSADHYFPNGMYLFVGDTIHITVDAAARKTDIKPGSICYWIDKCEEIYMRRYGNFGDVNNAYKVANEGKESVEKFCRNAARITKEIIDDIEKENFALPEGIDPIAAEIVKADAVMLGFYNIECARMFYNDKKYRAPELNVAHADPDFRPLNDKPYYRFLRKNEKYLLDNPYIALCSHASSLINRIEFNNEYNAIIFYRNAINKGIPGGSPKAFEEYAFHNLLPKEYDSRLMKMFLTHRNDTLLTLDEYYTLAKEDIRKKNGMGDNFVMQWCIARSVLTEIAKGEYDGDYAAEYVTSIIPHISNPIISHHLIHSYRKFIKKNELIERGENITSDSIIQKIIAPYIGNVIYLDFWATSCGPCRAKMLSQRSFIKDMEGRPVKFLYTTEECYREISEKWMQEHFIEGEHIYISSEEWRYLQAILKFAGIPHSCIIDREGNLHNDMHYSKVSKFL